MTTVKVMTKPLSELLDELNSKTESKSKEGKPMIYVTDDHKSQLEHIRSIHVVQSHVCEFLPQSGSKVVRADVADYLEDAIGDKYHLLAFPNSNGLEGALASVGTSLSHTKGFIEQGGSYYSHPELVHGEWKWADGGYEKCRNYIKRNSGYYPEELVELMADVAFNQELQSEDNDRVVEEQDPVVVEEPKPVVTEEDNWLKRANKLLDRLQEQIDRLIFRNKPSV